MSGLRILVVDDDVHVAGIIAAMLQQDHHFPKVVFSGSDALKKLDSEHFDLVLTDQQMPGVKGDQLATAIKQRFRSMPVILVASIPPSLSLPQIDHILVKPFSLMQLRTAVKEAFVGLPFVQSPNALSNHLSS